MLLESLVYFLIGVFAPFCHEVIIYTASKIKPVVLVEGRRAKPRFGFFFLSKSKTSVDGFWLVHSFVRVHFTTKVVPAVKLGILKVGLSWTQMFSIRLPYNSIEVWLAAFPSNDISAIFREIAYFHNLRTDGDRFMLRKSQATTILNRYFSATQT